MSKDPTFGCRTVRTGGDSSGSAAAIIASPVRVSFQWNRLSLETVFCVICGAWKIQRAPLCDFCYPRVRSLLPNSPYQRRLQSSLQVSSLFLWSSESPAALSRLAHGMKVSSHGDWSLWAEWICERIAVPRAAVFVPAPAKKWGVRDHAWLLAQALAQVTGFEFRNVLARSSRVEQKRLSGVARRSNRVELLDPEGDWSDYRTVIIVDDIVTSGGTMSACFEALGRPEAAQAWSLIDRAPCDVSIALV